MVPEKTGILVVGEVLGHYGIMEEIGKGGMGVVYKGWDTHLERSVALKVLLPEIVTSQEYRLRFSQEARAASALNHPNIITIYDINNTNDIDYIAMEYVEGCTLEKLITDGPIPLKRALGLAVQIADALGKAHTAGIIHRDLKPSNIMVTGEDHVKILDFGLAKLIPLSGFASNNPAGFPPPALTVDGRLLGTVFYMAPEQAAGKPVDARCDIFSFGLILYEMLTGQPPFEGNTNLALMTSILRDEPIPISQMSSGLPLEIERIVMRCLRKDPQKRWHSMSDLKNVLEDFKGDSVYGKRTRIKTLKYRSPRIFLALVPLLLAAAGIDFGIRKMLQPPVLLSKSTLKLEPGLWLDSMRREQDFQYPSRTAMVMAKNGNFIIYSASKDELETQRKALLYYREIGSLKAKPITGTDGGYSPFLSPDDKWLGFWADGKVKRVPVEGGTPVTLCEADYFFGGSWDAKNDIYFSKNRESGIFKISAGGGNVETLTTPDKLKEYSHCLPHCLPNGKGLLITIKKEQMDVKSSLAVLDLKTRQIRHLIPDAADGRYLGNGHIVFLRQGALMVAPFDLGKQLLKGEAVPVGPNIMQSINSGMSVYNTGAGQFSFSENGSWVYVEGGIIPDKKDELFWLDSQGKVESAVPNNVPFFVPRLSPDANRFAYATLGTTPGLWIHDIERNITSRLNAGEGRTLQLTWTPDNKRLIYAWTKGGPYNLYWRSADGLSPIDRLTTSEYRQAPGSVSPDGKTLAFTEFHPGTTAFDIFLMDLDSKRITPFLTSKHGESHPAISPDGRWIAYTCDESGRDEVYVSGFPEQKERLRVSPGGGTEAVWSRDGKQLYFRTSDPYREQVWAVDIKSGQSLSPGKPRMLFKLKGGIWSGADPVADWDISKDGKRFLMVRNEDIKPMPATEMVLVQNWFPGV